MKKVTVGKKGGRRHKLVSTDLLLGNYRGAVGVKTGNTDSAGYSVVSAAQRGGVPLYAVVLGTASDPQRFRDAKELLDWGFAHYRPQSLASSGTIVGQAPVSDYLDVSVPAAISRTRSATVLDLNGTIRRTVTIATVKAPIAGGGPGRIRDVHAGRQAHRRNAARRHPRGSQAKPVSARLHRDGPCVAVSVRSSGTG